MVFRYRLEGCFKFDLIMMIVYNILISKSSSISLSMNKQAAFVQPYQESPETDGIPLLQSTFQVFSEGRVYPDVNAKLYQNRLTFLIDNQEGTQNYQIEFCFQLCFEMLRPYHQQKKKWNIEDCYSIKFQKHQKYIEFRNPKEPSGLMAWRDILRTKLNQRGFHEQFKPVRELGRGSFANVYQVQSLQNKKNYAVKGFSKQEITCEQGGILSIIKEIEVIRILDHPNLMKIFAVYETKNSIYLVLELLAGGQLFDRISYTRRLRSSEVREIMRSLLNGLDALHERGFMHRDLKPENILFRETGSNSCVIADFGLAQRVDEPKPLFPRCGTPGYVAPEIANMKDSTMRYGSGCDMFSVGVIFHMLLIGKPPFLATNFSQALEQNKQCKLNFQSQIYGKLTSLELDLLKKMLSKNQDQRITVKAALNHQFLTKDLPKRELSEVSTELQEVSLNQKKKVPKVRVRKCPIGMEQVQSPILMTKNIDRKHQGLTREDSCLKFKMGDNLTPPSLKERDETMEFNKSPICPQKIRTLESRFKNKENCCA